MRMRSVAVAVMSTALLIALQSALAAPAQAAVPAPGSDLVVSPSRTVAPATVTATGGKCPSNSWEEYGGTTLELYQDGVVIDTADVALDADGTIVPPYGAVDLENDGVRLPPGDYTVRTGCGGETTVTVLESPTLTLSPTSGRAGTEVTASGTCPGDVSSGPDIYFDDQLVTTGSLETTGEFDSATFTVPDVAPGADHLVTTSCEGRAPFEVLPPPEVPATLKLDPVSGQVNDDVTATGTCPTSSEAATLHFGDETVGSADVDPETGAFGPLAFPVPAVDAGRIPVTADCHVEGEPVAVTFTVVLPPGQGGPSKPGTTTDPGTPTDTSSPASPGPTEGPTTGSGPTEAGSPTPPAQVSTPGGTRIVVPDLTGMSEDEAIAALGGLLVLANPTGADGRVQRQVPPPGTLVEPASAVSVVLGDEPPPSRLPLLLGGLLVAAAVVGGLVAADRVRRQRRRVQEEDWLDEQVRTEMKPQGAVLSHVPDGAVPGVDLRLEVRRRPARL
jgi:hypothetical protein